MDKNRRKKYEGKKRNNSKEKRREIGFLYFKILSKMRD